MVNQAVLYLFFATLLYSFINVGVKILSHLPTSEVVLYRASVSLVICAYFIWRKGGSFLGQNRKVLLLRGFFGTLALFSLFLCVQKIPLAVAVTLINLSPIFTVILAHLILKEKASPLQWLLLLFSFVGVYLVRGQTDPVPLVWMLLGVASAFFAGLAYTCVRVLRLSEDPLVVILYFPLVTIPLMGPLAAHQWILPQGWEWGILIAIGILTQIAQYLMTVAYQIETAARVMVFNYFGLFWGVILGWSLFDERLSVVQLLGVLLVFACLSANYFVSLYEKKSIIK